MAALRWIIGGGSVIILVGLTTAALLFAALKEMDAARRYRRSKALMAQPAQQV